MQWVAEAPANIALIKYMGKEDNLSNLPSNSSLSYTLDNLLTKVVLTRQDNAKSDSWQPLLQDDGQAIKLSPVEQQRFLAHLARIKQYFAYSGHFIVESNNNFPKSSGLASSASSFAALTKCAVHAICSLQNKIMPTIQEQANLSRLGSGSSCRSFFAPWSLWQADKVMPLNLSYNNLRHQVIIISSAQKKISSSLAHELVKTSQNYALRRQHAENNLTRLFQAFAEKNWEQAYLICWDEFHSMHDLFHSCAQPFSYLNNASQEVLTKLQKFWQEYDDGPLVTMDAGPNIHLLYRTDQDDLSKKFTEKFLAGQYNVL